MTHPNRLEAWLQSPLGCRLLEQESRLADEAVAGFFGLYALQVGCWGGSDMLLRAARTQRAAVVNAVAAPGISLISSPTQLAITSDSVDGVVLPHILELSSNPHQVLREAHRVLVGDGHLLIQGFNPLSLWGLRHLLKFNRSVPGIQRLMPEYRINDWLSLLGFEVVERKRYFHSVPINRESVLSKLEGLELVGRNAWPRLAACYMIVARKRVYTLTPTKTPWRGKRKLVGGLVEPTSRISCD
ncbi:MAG: class I SAM-dependent methyltransferase [Pseudomonadota bacterium]